MTLFLDPTIALFFLTQPTAIKTRQTPSIFQKISFTQRQNNVKKFINRGSSFEYCQATTTSTNRRAKIEDTLPSAQYLGPFWYFSWRILCVSRGKAAAVAEEILFWSCAKPCHFCDESNQLVSHWFKHRERYPELFKHNNDKGHWEWSRQVWTYCVCCYCSKRRC